MKTPILICAVVLSLAASGCLKTRSPVRNSSDEQSDDQGTDPAHKPAGPSKKISRYEIEEMKNEITRLTGKLEELEHNQQANSPADTREKMLALENRIAELEKNQIMILSEVKDIKDRGPSGKAGGGGNSSAKSLIDEGYAALASKNFEGAAEKFESALSRGAKGKEAADAHFGFGEARMGMRDFKAAIVQYSKVQEVFSKSPRVAASLYKIGLCFEKLNMKKESHDFFGELIERFPKSTEAKKARARLR